MTATPVVETFSWTSDGLTLVGDRWVVPSPRGTVVLLHGGGQTRHSWAATAAGLAAAGWQTVAYDARGHGDSEWSTTGDYGYEAGIADLRALLDSVDGAPALVGASMGGLVSLIAAGDDPTLASAVVLVDITARIEPEGSRRIRSFMSAHQNGFADLEEVAAAVQGYSRDRRRTRNLDGLRKNVRQRADGRWYWHWDPALLRTGDEPRRDATEARAVGSASGLRVPTMIVRGSRSDVVSDEGIAEMRELVPHAEFVEVAAGHMVAGDDNSVFTTELLGFLDRSLGADGDQGAEADERRSGQAVGRRRHRP